MHSITLVAKHRHPAFKLSEGTIAVKMYRLFVSHGAGKDAEATALIQKIYDGLNGSDIEVLLDRESLEGGDEWPETLIDWMFDCHGAILVLSPRALDRAWVVREATILDLRKREDPEFDLVPIYLDGVDEKVLADPMHSRMEILHLGRLQCERTGGNLLDRLRLRFDSSRHRHREITRLVRDVASKLGTGDDFALEHLATDLDLKFKHWLWRPKRRNQLLLTLALRMAAMDLRRVVRGLEGVVEAYTLPQAERIVRCLAPFEINSRAAANIPPIVYCQTGATAMRLNSEHPRTGRWYARRALGRYLPARFIEVTNSDDGFGGELLWQEVLDAILDFTDAYTTEEAQQELADTGKPVFLLLLGRRPDLRIVVRLAEHFPTVTAFFMAGASRQEQGPDEAELVQLLRPPLKEQEERRLLNRYNRSLRRLRKVWSEASL